jgi:hypothetical protein
MTEAKTFKSGPDSMVNRRMLVEACHGRIMCWQEDRITPDSMQVLMPAKS